MAAQALLTATVVGTVALNAAEAFLDRLHKKQAKKAGMLEMGTRKKEEKAREEEENSSEEEENIHEISRRNSDYYRRHPRRSSAASTCLDTSMQDPPPSRKRSPYPESTSQLSLNSGPGSPPALSIKPEASLEVYRPRNNSFHTSSTIKDPAVAHQIAHASSIVDEHKRERQNRRRFSSAGAGADVVPRVTAPVTQNLLTEHEDGWKEELDPLLLQLREQRKQRGRDVPFRPRPKPQQQSQLERYNTFPLRSVSPASQLISRDQNELTRSQSYGDATSTPPVKQRRTSQPSQWQIPENDERRKAAEYFASRPIRSYVANPVAPAPLIRSRSANNQRNPSPDRTKDMFISTSTQASTEDFSGVPPLTPTRRSSSRSTGYEYVPRDYPATVSDGASELHIDESMSNMEIAERGRSMVDIWLGNTNRAMNEKKGYPASETYLSDESKPNPSIYISRVNDEFCKD